jgi:1-acyl-sn-glycerol-3-phosphate acyltransferase
MGEEKYLGKKGYQWYKHYARFMNRHLMYRVEYIGKENLPALGEPCMIVSNHQNCANDPLNLLLGLENESHPYVIARGNVFSWHKMITKFFLWLGDFSFGYTRLAFETAAGDGFAHNIKIVPSAHHYADYFEPGVDVVIRFGQPISLLDYYELYKTKPRTAQRQVNELVRKQIEDMMLDIRDLEHYDDIDWLRQSEVNVHGAYGGSRRCGCC